MTLSVTLREVERVLIDAGSEVEAAEAHGCLVGGLAAVMPFRVSDWVGEILDAEAVAALDPTSLNALQSLYDETATALGGQDLDFVPLLPDDDAPLPQRTVALAHWCAGFLYGMGVGNLGSLDGVPGDVGEIVRDFTEITRAAVEDDAGEEINESAYAELVEYVRAGAQLVYEELADHRERVLPPESPTQH